MNSRRSFFKRIAALVAAVALAPEIAFGVTFPKPTLADLFHHDFTPSMLGRQPPTIYDFLMDREQAVAFLPAWNQALTKYYESKAGSVENATARTLSPSELEAVFSR